MTLAAKAGRVEPEMSNRSAHVDDLMRMKSIWSRSKPSWHAEGVDAVIWARLKELIGVRALALPGQCGTSGDLTCFISRLGDLSMYVFRVLLHAGFASVRHDFTLQRSGCHEARSSSSASTSGER